MKLALLTLTSLALACCNASDVVLYGAAATAGAGDVLGAAAAGNTGAGGSSGDATGGSGKPGAGAGGTDQSGGGSNLGGTPATGGSLDLGGTSAGGTDAASGGDDMTGSAGTEATKPCTTNGDCPEGGWYCAKATCTDAQGVCLPTPALCNGVAQPVCGCDHVTYLNTCVRQSFGVSAETPHECSDQNTPPCVEDAECGTDRQCAHLLPRPVDMCGPVGTCWGLPPDCEGDETDGEGDGDMTRVRHWSPCGQALAPTCITTCQAILSGGVYVPSPPGQMCP